MTSRTDALWVDLKGYDASFNEHMDKVHHGTDVNSILGWLNDCRHFTEKAYELALHIADLDGNNDLESEAHRIYKDRIQHIETHEEQVRQYLRRKRDSPDPHE